ncbi:MAG: winged helix-turn-helix transcriptional regulator [Chloroflexota bacterium]
MTTRDKILEILINKQRCSINEIAMEVGINPISVRHHITRLEANGTVASDEERHGVGRPRRIYFLTSKGMELFPSRYLNLSTRLLGQLKKEVPQLKLEKLLRDMAKDMAKELVPQERLQDLEFDERLILLERILTNEGFTVEIEKSPNSVVINETSCPYIHVGQEHHEVCVMDETLINNILGTKVKQINCMLDGDVHCTYEVPIISSSEISIRS